LELGWRDLYLPSGENSLSVRRLADCLLFLEELEWKVGMFTSIRVLQKID
jgi:hypothetical protein